MDNKGRPPKRKRRQQYRVVTSADVITLGKPLKSNADKVLPPRQIAPAPERLRKLTAAERHLLLKPPAIKEAILKIASDPSDCKQKLAHLVSQTAIAKQHCAMSRDDCESVVFLLLELGVFIRRCPVALMATLVDATSNILLLTLSRSCIDSRVLILPAVAAIQAALDRIDDEFPWPTCLIKCYVHDKMLASPQWTNLVESRPVCRWILDNCLYGRQRFFIDDKSCKLEQRSGRGRFISYDEETALYTCEQIFFSNATEKRQWAIAKPKGQEGFTPEQFRLMGDCAVFHGIRKHLVLHKMESWLQDPKTNKIALELLAAVITNGRPGEDDAALDNGGSIISHILQLQLKPSVIQQVLLPAVHIQCLSSTEHLRMYVAECVFYLVRNSGDPSRGRNIAMSVLHTVFDFSPEASSTFLGEALPRSLAELPRESELQMCCSILKELSLSSRSSPLRIRLVQKGLLFNAGWISNSFVVVMDLNLILIMFEVMQTLRKSAAAVTDETVLSPELLSLLRPTVLQWQLESLNFLSGLTNATPDSAFQRCVSSCFFFNPELEPFSTVSAIATENDRLAAVHAIVSSGTKEEIIVKLLEIACDPKLPISQQSVLEMIEQIVRRTAYSTDYGASLSIESIDTVLEEIRACCVATNKGEPGRRLLDAACFWRSCFILVFIVCLTDSEHDMDAVRVLARVPTVRVMLEILLTGQYVPVPNTALLRLGRGCKETFQKLCHSLVLEEERQVHGYEPTLYSEHYCDNWPRTLNNIQLGKLKALNHSHKLSNRLLSNHPSVVESILSELIQNRAQNPTLFDVIFKDLAPIMSERLNMGQLVPIDCLCQFLLTEDDESGVFSTIKDIVTEKLRKPSHYSLDVLAFFMSQLGRSPLKPILRERIWSKLEELLLGEKLTRLWQMAPSHTEGPKTYELAESVVKALTLESDQRHGLLLLDLTIEMLESSPRIAGSSICSTLITMIEKRPKFWECLLRGDNGMTVQLRRVIQANVARDQLGRAMRLLSDKSGCREGAGVTDLGCLVKKAVSGRLPKAQEEDDLSMSPPQPDVPYMAVEPSSASNQPLISSVGDVDIRSCFYGDVDLRSRPEHSQTQQISNLITGSLRRQISVEDFAQALLKMDRNDVVEALIALAGSKETGEWLLAELNAHENRVIKHLLSQKTNKFKHVPALCALTRETPLKQLSGSSPQPTNEESLNDESDVSQGNLQKDDLARAELAFVLLCKAISQIPDGDKETNCQTIADHLELLMSRNKSIIRHLLPLVEAAQKDPQYKRNPKALAVLQLLHEAKNTSRAKTNTQSSAYDQACDCRPRPNQRTECLPPSSFAQDRWPSGFWNPYSHEQMHHPQDPRQRAPCAMASSLRRVFGEARLSDLHPTEVSVNAKERSINQEECYTLCRQLSGWTFDEEDVSKPDKRRAAQETLDKLLPRLVQMGATKPSTIVAKTIDVAFNSSLDSGALSQLANAIGPALNFYPGLS